MEKTKKELQQEVDELTEALHSTVRSYQKFAGIGSKVDDILATIVQRGNEAAEFVIPSEKGLTYLFRGTTNEMDLIELLASDITDLPEMKEKEDEKFLLTAEDIRKRVKLIVLMASRINVKKEK